MAIYDRSMKDKWHLEKDTNFILKIYINILNKVANMNLIHSKKLSQLFVFTVLI